MIEGKPGVLCSDCDIPDDHVYWSLASARADEQFGYFGQMWTWFSSFCAVWDGFDADRYLRPFDRTPANLVLLVGTRFDPASPYENVCWLTTCSPLSAAHGRGVEPHLCRCALGVHR